jgi:hypothetical protein
MPSDQQQLETIKSQTLAILADITANPKPSYNIDGQSISWTEYLGQLQRTIDWCDRGIAAAAPTELHTEGGT